MKNIASGKICSLILLTVISVLGATQVSAQDKWLRLIDLSGKWKFSIGDKSAWSDPSFNDGSWENISVPSKWEDEGFNGYNGYAWYRTTFDASQLAQKVQGVNL